MKNTIYTDADLNALLLRGEEYDGNTIEIVIDADDTANQELTIAAGDASATETITPGTRNTVEIPRMIWNFGGATTVTLSKDGTDAETITLTFPAAIDIDAGAALNETETANEYRMDGSQSLQQQIVAIQEQLQTFSLTTIDYILPSAISQADIADGASNTVLRFEISCEEENARTAMIAEIQFLAETTVTGSTYGDLLLTANIALDGISAGTLLKTYRDGRQVLKVDYLFTNLSKGNHTITVTLSAAGGALSLMQIFTAFILAAKSTGSETITVMPIFTDGQWAPDVLPEGLRADRLTEEAMQNGVEDTAIKYARADEPTGDAVSVSALSQYFESDYILCNGQHYAEPFYQKEDYFRKQATHGHATSNTGKPIQYTGTEFWVPINRVSGFTALEYEAKTIADNGRGGVYDYNVIRMAAGAIVNGEMQFVSDTHAKNPSWATYTIDISSLPYIDYICFRGIDGSPAYRNIRLTRS